MFIEQPPLLYRLLFPEAIWRINRAGAATVYLTFDDGPIPEVTPQVLDILDAASSMVRISLVVDADTIPAACIG